MEPKKSKYDTNPLDPDFVKNAGADPGDSRPDTQEVSGATREIGSSGNESARSNIHSEAPTRRYDNVNPESPYQSVFVPPTYSPPTPYQPPPAPYRPIERKPTHRPVAGLGLPEKWAMMLPYTPFYVGVVPALLVLFLVPRNDPRVRFHAAQGLALHIAILVIRTLFGVVGTITGSSIGGVLFSAVALVFLIVSMIRVWKGETHFIAPLAEPAQWLNEKIAPRNKS
ncbi:MAG TPA: DUF4870 domain-containing protein [Pyrinomonadaceae bacterium]|jgi:uncharacterized membrane protein|nr:DUF4870 domain-containing protein [Pyrinomonadaceae bacterium]